jgi:hypothetical protein
VIDNDASDAIDSIDAARRLLDYAELAVKKGLTGMALQAIEFAKTHLDGGLACVKAMRGE